MNLTPEEQKENDEVGVVIGVVFGVVLALIFAYYTSSEWPNISNKSELITRGLSFAVALLLRFIGDEPLAVGMVHGWIWTCLALFVLAAGLGLVRVFS